MQRLLTCVLAIGCVGTGGLFVRGTLDAANPVEVERATDGAFRDGLYLGKLDRIRGRAAMPARGRWSSEKDRASFARGYRQGFSQTHGQ